MTGNVFKYEAYRVRLQNIKPEKYIHTNSLLQTQLQQYVVVFKHIVANLITFMKLAHSVLPSDYDSAETLTQDILNTLEGGMNKGIVLGKGITLGDSFQGVYQKIQHAFRDYIVSQSTNGKILEKLMGKLNILNDNSGDFTTDDLSKRLEMLTGRITAIEKIDPKEFEKSREEINQILNNARNISDELAGLGKSKILSLYANEFKKSSEESKTIANYWLIGVLGQTLLIIFSVVFKFFDYATIGISNGLEKFLSTENFPIGESELRVIMISQLSSKLLLIALFVFILFFIIKQYLINKNLEVVNRNKATALKSYFLFKESTGDDNETLKTIMNEVAKMIYSNIDSGFLKYKNVKLGSGLGSLFTNIVKDVKEV